MAKHAYHRGTRVSKSHAILLAAYEEDTGRKVEVNEGRRTLREQALFYAKYKRDGWPVAARPFPGAPHIKYGKEHHALDIDIGVVDNVAAYYRRRGIPVAFNVRGEGWHMDVLNEAKLKAAAVRQRGSLLPTLRRGHKGPSVLRLKKYLYSQGIRNFSGRESSSRFEPFFGKYTEAAVKRFQRANGLKADGVVGPTTWRKLQGK